MQYVSNRMRALQTALVGMLLAVTLFGCSGYQQTGANPAAPKAETKQQQKQEQQNNTLQTQGSSCGLYGYKPVLEEFKIVKKAELPESQATSCQKYVNKVCDIYSKHNVPVVIHRDDPRLMNYVNWYKEMAGYWEEAARCAEKDITLTTSTVDISSGTYTLPGYYYRRAYGAAYDAFSAYRIKPDADTRKVKELEREADRLEEKFREYTVH